MPIEAQNLYGIQGKSYIEFLRIATVAALAGLAAANSLITRLSRKAFVSSNLAFHCRCGASKRKRQPKEETAGNALSRCNYMQVLRVYSVDPDASGGLGQYHALKYVTHAVCSRCLHNTPSPAGMTRHRLLTQLLHLGSRSTSDHQSAYQRRRCCRHQVRCLHQLLQRRTN